MSYHYDNEDRKIRVRPVPMRQQVASLRERVRDLEEQVSGALSCVATLERTVFPPLPKSTSAQGRLCMCGRLAAALDGKFCCLNCGRTWS